MREMAISTAGLKSDVAIGLFDSDFFVKRANFGDSSINIGYNAYFKAQARNGHIYTSGVKCDND